MLVGVRISAFVSADDKKPLQKSIVSFLQPGKADSSGSSTATRQKLGKDHLSIHSLPSSPLVCLVQQPEEAPVWRKRKEADGAKTGQQPQQSFFQRAHAKRLQTRGMNASTQEGNASVIISPGTYSQKGMESSSIAHKSCAASDLSENDCVSTAEAHASTSGCGGPVSESLTCPVCFTRVGTTDLHVFNRHIDQCLNDASRNRKQSIVSDTESDLEPENDRKGCKAADTGQEVEEEKAQNAELESDGVTRHRFRNNSIQAASLIKHNNETTIIQQPETRTGQGPVLICPICQLTQDNDDLIMFNHHVDLCLNQEVLHELGQGTSSLLNPPSVTNIKAFGECVC